MVEDEEKSPKRTRTKKKIQITLILVFMVLSCGYPKTLWIVALLLYLKDFFTPHFRDPPPERMQHRPSSQNAVFPYFSSLHATFE